MSTALKGCRWTFESRAQSPDVVQPNLHGKLSTDLVPHCLWMCEFLLSFKGGALRIWVVLLSVLKALVIPTSKNIWEEVSTNWERSGYLAEDLSRQLPSNQS